LGFAEGSPVGRAEEKQRQPVRPAKRFECLRPPGLIGGLKLGDGLTDGGAGLHVLIGGWNGTEAGAIVGSGRSKKSKGQNNGAKHL
jgi:hypothetical protein